MNTWTYTLTTSEHLITASVVNSTSNNALRRKTHCRISYYDNDFARHKMTWTASVFFLFYWDDSFSAVLKTYFFLYDMLSPLEVNCVKKKAYPPTNTRAVRDGRHPLTREVRGIKYDQRNVVCKKIETLLIFIKWLNSRGIVRGDMIFLPCYMYVNHNTKVLSPRSALLPRHQWNLLSNETRVSRTRANVDNGE